MKNTIGKLIRDEKGAAMAFVVILLLIGGLIVSSLLSYMGTGFVAGEVYERRTDELYAADAGVEDALWQIQNEKLADLFYAYPYDVYDYHTSYCYPEPLDINDKDVNVTIQNIWIPEGVLREPAPDKDTARQIIEEGKVVITGGTSLAEASRYEIKISYEPCGGTPSVETIGIWLPSGFEYEGDCSLEGEDYYSEPTVTPHKGGYAVVWSFSLPVYLADFPDSFTFQYSGPQGQTTGAAVSWIDTTMGYTWDADVKIYKVSSTATDPDTGSQTTVEGYSSKVEMRKLGSALSGDYHAIGATLMTPKEDSAEGQKYRDRLFRESSATINEGDIPSNAIIEAAWLYWSGWIEGDGLPFSATCVEDAKVNRVLFNGNEITADPSDCQAEPTPEAVGDSWCYSCFYDVTDIVLAELDPDTKGGTFTLGHVLEGNGYDLYPNGTTNYPLATPALSRSNKYQWTYAGWSLLVVYSSPETKGHQLYLFDQFRYVAVHTTLDFPVSGFLVPDPVGGELNAAHITCFVGDGDEHYPYDFIALLDAEPSVPSYQIPENCKLWDGITCNHNNADSPNNVWNSQSTGLTASGVDIDNFQVTWSSGLLEPGDTSTWIVLGNASSKPQDAELIMVVYIILSFRSETTNSGLMGYMIR